jgi:hypothetical protein
MKKFLYAFVLTLFSVCSLKAEAWYSAPLQAQELMFGNALKWSTIWEINLQQFVVEKSMDGIDFDEIGTLDANGFSNVDHSYHFMDVNPLGDIAHYRLKEIGDSGTFSYSAIITVEKTVTNDLHILGMSNLYVSSDFSVKFDVIKDLKVTCNLKNLRGKLLDTWAQDMKNGLNDVKVDLKQRNPGLYFLEVINGTEVEHFTLMRVENAETKLPPVANLRSTKIKN